MRMEVPVYSCKGEVLSPKEFVEKFIGHVNISELEKKVLSQANLPSTITNYISTPLTIAESYTSEISQYQALKLGERSAYIQEYEIKLKGCNPIEGKTFPSESCFFGKEKVDRSYIPFGSLTTESAMREILGYAFFSQHDDLNTNITPIAVFDYGGKFCIAEKTKGEQRLESFMMSIENDSSSNIQGTQMNNQIYQIPIGSEVPLLGINIRAITEKLTREIVTMNFHGGFRDYFNSNRGNTVLINGNVYLCDFDTFQIIEIPKNPDKDFLKKFCLQSILEMIEGSLPIEGVVQTPKTGVRKYLEISSFWPRFLHHFSNKVEENGWNKKDVSDIINDIVSKDIVERTVALSIISNLQYERDGFYEGRIIPREQGL